jgi:hypothetical protein
MNDQAVFYALSMLAQTCAALAAFVGAVGVYRLQSLKDKRRGLLQSIYARRGNPTEAVEIFVAQAAEYAKAQNDHELQDLLTRYGQVAPTIQRNVSALCLFEAWNLFVILISLAGFAHTHRLVGSWWTPRALWCIAVITVIVTGYGVVVWLKSDD